MIWWCNRFNSDVDNVKISELWLKCLFQMFKFVKENARNYYWFYVYLIIESKISDKRALSDNIK